jgi:hypothetical protein
LELLLKYKAGLSHELTYARLHAPSHEPLNRPELVGIRNIIKESNLHVWDYDGDGEFLKMYLQSLFEQITKGYKAVRAETKKSEQE